MNVLVLAKCIPQSIVTQSKEIVVVRGGVDAPLGMKIGLMQSYSFYRGGL